MAFFLQKSKFEREDCNKINENKSTIMKNRSLKMTLKLLLSQNQSSQNYESTHNISV